MEEKLEEEVMSTLSTMCDNLRLMARLVREYNYDVISHELRKAADTIWSLRNKLGDLQDERYELRAENAKLRELVRDMFEEIEVGGFDPMVERNGKSTVYYEEDPSWRVGIRKRVRELGIDQ